MTPYQIAKKYIGKTEKPGNMGFNDAEFEKKMVAVGFQKTHAWCCYFAELVFKEAFPEKSAVLDKLFSASCVKTFQNFEEAGYVIHKLPKENTLCIMQMFVNGVGQSTGHATVCGPVKPDKWRFDSVEGNTNDIGGREGYIVAERIRKTIKDVDNGLKVIGFIEI
jgi:hypothetical protein